MNKEKIGIIGLGKLGLPMLSAFVSRGFDVFGYDLSEKLITTLKSGSNPYKEPGIDKVIGSDVAWSNRFFHKLEKLIEEVDVLFLIVPTPTKGETFDISFLLPYFKFDKNLSSLILYLLIVINILYYTS